MGRAARSDAGKQSAQRCLLHRGGADVFWLAKRALAGPEGDEAALAAAETRPRYKDAVARFLLNLSELHLEGADLPERTDTAALVIGRTGLALSGSTLYVADSLDNRIAAIANAPTITSSVGIGQDVAVGGALDDPLGMTLAPNGDLVAVNGNDGKAVAK